LEQLHLLRRGNSISTLQPINNSPLVSKTGGQRRLRQKRKESHFGTLGKSHKHLEDNKKQGQKHSPAGVNPSSILFTI